MSGWLSRLFDPTVLPQDYSAPANQLGPLAQQVMRNPVGTETTSPYASQSVGVPQGPFNPIEAMTSSGQPILGTDMDRARAAVAQGMQEAPAMVLGMVGDAPGGKGFTAYHGSPHSFDAFDTAAIGTGEGAQAYGHGLYFADKEGVARGYRDQLSGGTLTYDGKPLGSPGGVSLDRSIKMRIDQGMTPQEALKDTLATMRYMGKGDFVDQAEQAWSNPDLMRYERNPGHMYEVNINAPPEHFLDWDKPLSEQSQHVQDTLGQLGITPPPKYSVRSVDGGHVVDFQHGDQQWTVPRVYQSADEAARQAEITKQLMSGNPTGREVLDYLIGPGQQGRVAAHADAADILRDAGIPGIRYLDAGSRAGGEGTRNTVIFDPATIEILRKYGIAGLMAGGAGAAATQKPQQ
jgi:hypothetical protein